MGFSEYLKTKGFTLMMICLTIHSILAALFIILHFVLEYTEENTIRYKVFCALVLLFLLTFMFYLRHHSVILLNICNLYIKLNIF